MYEKNKGQETYVQSKKRTVQYVLFCFCVPDVPYKFIVELYEYRHGKEAARMLLIMECLVGICV